jgi:uncharacterized repeat protein (TIGR01451 family)
LTLNSASTVTATFGVATRSATSIALDSNLHDPNGNPLPASFGQSVTFTATVTPTGGGTPTGGVRFYDGTTSLSTVQLTQVNGLWQAQLMTSSLSRGVHYLKASYLGDSSFLGSNTTQDFEQPVSTVDCSVSTGMIAVDTPPPSDVTLNAHTDTAFVHVFDERPLTRSTGSNISVDITQPGVYDSVASIPVAKNLAKGVTVASHMIHADRPGSQTANPITLAGCITYDTDILGLVVNSDRLVAGDTLLGHDGTTYPDAEQGYRGPEFDLNSDFVVVDPDHRTLRFTLQFANFMDEVRVLTAAPPAPKPTVALTARVGGLTAPATSSLTGQTVDFDANVSPPDAGVATGSVAFSVDGGPAVNRNLTNGVATLETSTLAIGSHTIDAHYNGDDSYDEADATRLNFQVQPIHIDCSSAPPVDHVVPAPTNLSLDAYESDTEVRLLDERTAVPIDSTNRQVDFTVPATLTNPAVYQSTADLPAGGALLPLNTTVDSHLLHADSLGDANAQPPPPIKKLAGCVTFDSDIVGVQLLTATLNGGDSGQHQTPFGNDGTTYAHATSYRGLELDINNDFVVIAPDRRTLEFYVEFNRMDEIRVLTESQASVMVQKTAVGGDGSFGFSLSGPTPTSDQVVSTTGGYGTTTWPGLDPGTYVLTESGLPTGWDLTGAIVCRGNGGTLLATTLVANGVSFNVSAGENVTCAFTNTARASVSVRKVTVPAGSAQGFDFTLTQGATTVGSLPGVKSTDPGPTAFATVSPGTYSVAEVPVAGWDPAGAVCDNTDTATVESVDPASLVLGAGEHWLCTFTNTARASVSVRKVTVPAGSAQGFDFTLTQGATTVGSLSGVKSTDPGPTAFARVRPGTYALSEGAVAGWNVTNPQPACDNTDTATVESVDPAALVLGAGEHWLCTFTNAQMGRITVVKQTVGGDALFNFTGDLTGVIGNGGSLWKDVVPGTYHVAESPAAGWDLSGLMCNDSDSVPDPQNAAADFHVSGGENVTCTFTNTARASVSVRKVTVPAGAAQGFDFTLTQGATTVGSLTGVKATDPGPTAFAPVRPGTYALSEGAVAGWTVTNPQPACDNTDTVTIESIAPAQLVLGAGEHWTCTFTNAALGSITVVKRTVGGDGGFTFRLSNQQAKFVTTVNGIGSQTWTALPAQLYTLSENPLTNWDLSGTPSCDNLATPALENINPNGLSLHVGDMWQCTFTNIKRGSITVVKKTIGGDGTFGFTLTGQLSKSVVTTNGTGSQTWAGLVPGQYALAENAVTNWDLIASSCDNSSTPSVPESIDPARIVVGPGEDWVCTFRNQKRGSITAQMNTIGGDGNFTFSLTNQPNKIVTTSNGAGQQVWGALVPGPYALTEAVPAGWDAIPPTPACDNRTTSVVEAIDPASLVIAPGDNWLCTFTNQKRATISVRVATVPANSDPTTGFDFTLTQGSISLAVTGVKSSDAVATPFPAVAAGVISISETPLALWDPSATCDDLGTTLTEKLSPTNLTVAAGANWLCTFTNTEHSADLVVANSAKPTMVLPGQPITYTVTVTNPTGPYTAFANTVTDTFGAVTITSMAVAPAPPGPVAPCVQAQSTNGAATVTCALPDIAMGAPAVTVTITAIARLVGSLTSTATVSSSTYDAKTANNTKVSTVTVNAPANGKLAFQRTGSDGMLDIFTRTTTGTLKALPADVPHHDDLQPVWSPDGTHIAFASDRTGISDQHDSAHLEIYVTGVAGSTPVQLTNNTTEDTSPSWSPDGTQIVFNEAGGSGFELMTVDVATGAIHDLGIAGGAPKWSPWLGGNCSAIAYQHNPGTGTEAYIAQAPGTVCNSSQLPRTGAVTKAADGDNFGPRWSPDGNYVMVSSSRSGNFELYRYNLVSLTVVPYTNNSAKDGSAAWAPDGSAIVFVSDRTGGVDHLFSITSPSSATTQLTTGGLADGYPDWQPT